VRAEPIGGRVAGVAVPAICAFNPNGLDLDMPSSSATVDGAPCSHQRIAGALGVEATPDVLAKAIVADPDNELALRRTEAEAAEKEPAYVSERLAAEETERDKVPSTEQLGWLRDMAAVMFPMLSLTGVALEAAA